MVSLTDIAFPGYFRIRTCEMGPYFGIRSAGGSGNNAGRLVAMCGERMNINTPAARLIAKSPASAPSPNSVAEATRPALLAHMLHLHRTAGMRSYLHVAPDNATAIALYQRLGFAPRGEFPLYSVRKLS